MATELQYSPYHMNADPSFHQVSMAAAAAGSAAAAQASTYAHHPTSMVSVNPYFSHHQQQQQQQQHPYYSTYFHPSQPEYGSSAMLDPYPGDFRPTFYNPFEIKHRRRTSRAQLKILEKSFLENTKPNASVRRYLAQELEMTPRGVQIWFQNRRAKAKLQKRKSQQQQVNGMSPTLDGNASSSAAAAAFLMTPMSSNASTTSSSTSSGFHSSSSPHSLFYPMDDIRSVATQAAAQSMLMADQAWMAMPMHPLQQQQQSPSVSTTDEMQRRQSCPLLSNEWDPSTALQQPRRASDYPLSSPNHTHGLSWLEEKSCSSSSTSSCDTPQWTLGSITPGQPTTQQYSPLSDHALLDLYQKQQQKSDSAYTAMPTTSALDFDPSVPSLMSCLL
ncbi:unnamed protein product [Absidia cylindrospora]